MKNMTCIAGKSNCEHISHGVQGLLRDDFGVGPKRVRFGVGFLKSQYFQSCGTPNHSEPTSRDFETFKNIT